MRGLAAVVGLVLAVGCKPASSAVEVRKGVFLTTVVGSYPVAADDFSHAKDVVRDKGELESSFRAGFDNEWSHEVSGCRATSLRVELEVTHKFPSWSPHGAGETAAWRELLVGLENLQKERDEILADEFATYVADVYGMNKVYSCDDFRATLAQRFDEAQKRVLARWEKAGSDAPWRAKKKHTGPEI